MLDLLDITDVGFCVLNTRRGLVSADEIYARILGLDLDRIDVRTLPCCTYADDEPMVTRTIQDVVTDGRERMYRKRSVRSNGDLIWVENRLSVLERDETTTLLLATRIIERPDQVLPAPIGAWEPKRLSRYIGEMTSELSKMVADAHLSRTAAVLRSLQDIAELEAAQALEDRRGSFFTPLKSHH